MKVHKGKDKSAQQKECFRGKKKNHFSQLKRIAITLNNNKVKIMGLHHNCNLLPEFEKELWSATTEALASFKQFERENKKKKTPKSL